MQNCFESISWNEVDQLENLLRYLSAACFAFTFSTIVYSLFRWFEVFPPLSENMVFSLLLISITITFLIFLTHRLPIENPILIHLFEIGCVVVAMTGAGAFFNVYPFGLFYTGMTVMSGVIAYSFVIVLVYLNNKADEQKINTAILQRRKRDAEYH